LGSLLFIPELAWSKSFPGYHIKDQWIGFRIIFSNFNVCRKIISPGFGALETCRKSAITFEEWRIFLLMINKC
jgi:hypothetical protein